MEFCRAKCGTRLVHIINPENELRTLCTHLVGITEPDATVATCVDCLHVNGTFVGPVRVL